MKLSILLLIPMLLVDAKGQPSPPFEEPTVVHASDLLEQEILRGEAYRVRDLVVTDGYLAHFSIDSDFGTFDAIGVPQARRRIVEIAAIKRLVETSKSDLFAEGMRRSIEQPIDAVKNIVAHPIDSAKEAPKTVGHFFTKVGKSISRGAQKVNQQVQDARENDVDSATVAKETGKGIGTAAKNAAGFDKAKLDTAKQLGVDPYTDNLRLQDEMDKVTWAFFAGGLPLRIGATVLSAGVAVAATNMVGIPEDIYALTESELALRDQETLIAMGVTDEDISTFQLSQALSTTRRHRIVNCLKAMPKTAGRGSMIVLANSCQTQEEADFLVEAVSILASRQLSAAADYSQLHVLGRLPGGVSSQGNLEVPAPVDYVTWTAQVAAFANRDDLGISQKVLIHTGILTESAASGFASAGWKTIQVEYPQ
ncbi:hypothetical protein JIN85_00720 [Luteolibacter pohnpeiensis]|uniref:Uncharacterized protein n=1 Tax=Luteolibacter pohnpeiensis TaxID=454153 RepID=A0A934VUM5_9BACT|nr:hypothetical protein [Luteolibacter pohnpeiensis]MBK1880913.1 hypothetical protein [Luteolibacter pohnpeiensis]